MGYDGQSESNFRIPVSDTQAYRQFGNSFVVPVFAAVAKLMKERVVRSRYVLQERQKEEGRLAA
jgi:DNA (cytosine-5)-methyltransferase 1